MTVPPGPAGPAGPAGPTSRPEPLARAFGFNAGAPVPADPFIVERRRNALRKALIAPGFLLGLLALAIVWAVTGIVVMSFSTASPSSGEVTGNAILTVLLGVMFSWPFMLLALGGFALYAANAPSESAVWQRVAVVLLACAVIGASFAAFYWDALWFGFPPMLLTAALTYGLMRWLRSDDVRAVFSPPAPMRAPAPPPA